MKKLIGEVIAALIIVYGTYRLMAWLDKRRELMELQKKLLRKQIRGEDK